jgi:hypothetical protein
LGARGRGLRRRPAENWLVLATGGAAALPVIVAVAAALSNRWVPLQDDGIIVLRSWDVLTDQSPLVGQYSQATLKSVGNAYSPGPLLYWLLALPVRLFGFVAVAVTIGLLNIASIMGTVALARRRGGVAFMFATALALVLMCRSLPEEVFVSPFNPTVPILPCTLLVFLAWSLACGEIRLLPVTALVASFVTQTHLSYVPLTAGLLAIGAGGLVYRRRRARRRPDGIGARPWVLAAALVVVVCWVPPVIDVVVHDPSNVEVLARTAVADRPKVGAEAAWHAVVRAFGVPPWWLHHRVDALGRFLDTARAPHALSVVSSLLVVGGLLFVAVVAWRRRSDAAAAPALALVLVGAFAVLTGSTPAERVLTLGYTMQWGSAAGMFAWLALGLGVVSVVTTPRTRLVSTLAAPGRAGAAVAAGLAVVTIAGAGVGIAQPGDSRSWLYAPARTSIDRLDSELRPGASVFLAAAPFEVYGAITYALRRQGVRVLVAPPFVEAMGSYYDVTGRRYDQSVVLEGGDHPAPKGGRILARIPIRGPVPPEAERVFTLALGPGGAGPAR